MDDYELLSIISNKRAVSARHGVDEGSPYPEKMAVAQSKNQGEKKRGHRLPGVALA